MFSTNDLIKAKFMQEMLAQQQNQQGAPGQGTEPFMQQVSQGEQMIKENSPRNPIESGANIGLEAAKRSLEMSPREERRAIGRGLINFASSFAANAPEPGTGIAGALGAMNKSFLPGLNAYDAERGRSESANFAIMKMIDEQARHAREEDFKRQQIEEQSRYHDMMEPVHAAHAEHYNASSKKLKREENMLEDALKKKEMLISEGIMPEGSVMLNEILDKDERKLKQKKLQADQKMYAPAIQNLRNLDKLDKIIKSNPNLWKKNSRALEAMLRGDEKGLKQILQGMTNERDKADLDVIDKIANDYALQQAAANPNGRTTDVHKKMTLKSFVNAYTHPEAASYISQVMRRNTLRVAKNARNAAIGWKNGFVPPEDTSDLDEYLDEHESGEQPIKNQEPLQETGGFTASPQVSSTAKEISTQFSKEEIEAAIARKRNQVGINP
jgi:hypothetical protein